MIDFCCCFCFIFTFSFYRVINNNKMPPKKKQKLYTSLAEQQQLLEDFYNDFTNLFCKPFLVTNLVVKEKMKEIFLALLQTLMLMYLIKIPIVLHNQLMRKTLYQGNKSLKVLIISWTWIITIFTTPRTYYFSLFWGNRTNL